MLKIRFGQTAWPVWLGSRSPSVVRLMDYLETHSVSPRGLFTAANGLSRR